MSHKRVFALLTPDSRGWKMAQMLQKPVFALPGCQQTSVNTLLCDTLGLAEFSGVWGSVGEMTGHNVNSPLRDHGLGNNNRSQTLTKQLMGSNRE